MADWQVWLIAAVVLAIGEILTAGFFVLWFALGAGAATIAALLGLNIDWQTIIFLLVSFLLVLFTRPIVQRFAHRRDANVKTNLEAIEGKLGLVTEQIDNVVGTGQVRLQGETWSARSVGGEHFAVGTRVTIVGVDGVRLVVRGEHEQSEKEQ